MARSQDWTHGNSGQATGNNHRHSSKEKAPALGHIFRMYKNRLLKTLMFGMVHFDRQPGRSSRRWIDNILKWCGKDMRGAALIISGRTQWRKFVTGPKVSCWSWDKEEEEQEEGAGAGRGGLKQTEDEEEKEWRRKRNILLYDDLFWRWSQLREAIC